MLEITLKIRNPEIKEQLQLIVDTVNAQAPKSGAPVTGTLGAPGAIRYAAGAMYISVGESTADVNNWKQVALT